ncbi:MAG TPA: hypothetical protein VIW72_10150 [Burkholderiales bacterium]
MSGKLGSDENPLRVAIVGSGPSGFYLVEVTYRQQMGTVYKGRYWMNAQGVGGIEGGPTIFDLGAAARQRSGGGLYGGNSRTTPFGHLGSDGSAPITSTPRAAVAS